MVGNSLRHGKVLLTIVAADALVLMHQGISIHNTETVLLYLLTIINTDMLLTCFGPNTLLKINHPVGHELIILLNFTRHLLTQ